MWQMKEWFLKFVVQAVWRRKKVVYYAVSVVSIAGNLVVLVGPSLQASIVLRSGALQAVRSALPQVAEVVSHRSVLYILLNLIVASILVKSGMLGRAPGMPAKPVDEFCPPSSYCVFRGLPWPANNTYTVYGMQSAPGVNMFTDPSVSLQQAPGDDHSRATVDVCTQTLARQHPSINKSCDGEQPLRQAHGDNQNRAMVGVCAQTPARQHPSINKSCDGEQPLRQAHGDDQNRAMVGVCAQTPARQRPSINKSCDGEQPKCAPAPSIFTIEPLNELVQTTESYTTYDDGDHMDKTLGNRLRKVASRAVDLHRSMEGHAGAFKDSMIKAERQQKKNEEGLQVVLARQDEDVDNANPVGEHDDNELSRQEFNERVDTFIVKFKRSLTMQRQDSLNRLLGLVGGGGDIRLIK